MVYWKDVQDAMLSKKLIEQNNVALCHFCSLTLYWKSFSYRSIRGLRWVSFFKRKIRRWIKSLTGFIPKWGCLGCRVVGLRAAQSLQTDRPASLRPPLARCRARRRLRVQVLPSLGSFTAGAPRGVSPRRKQASRVGMPSGSRRRSAVPAEGAVWRSHCRSLASQALGGGADSSGIWPQWPWRAGHFSWQYGIHA